MTVNAVKKNNFDNQVVRLVNDLTKKWKKIIAESSSGKENSTPSAKSSMKQNEAVNRKLKNQETCASTHITSLAPSNKAVLSVSVRCATTTGGFGVLPSKLMERRRRIHRKAPLNLLAAAPISSNATDSVPQKSREMLCAPIKGGTSVEGASDSWYLAKILEEYIHKEVRKHDSQQDLQPSRCSKPSALSQFPPWRYQPSKLCQNDINGNGIRGIESQV